MSPRDMPIVSIVLGSHNRRPFLSATLESVRKNGMDFPYEIIVVDGGSTDGSMQYLAKQKDVITIIQHNRGEFRGRQIERRSWGYFMNLGFKVAQGKYILMISDDCLLIPDAIKNGVERFEKLLAEGQKVGAMAFYWRNWPEQKEYWVCHTLSDKLTVNHGMYLCSALQEIGWADEKFIFYYADGDICLRLWQKGYIVVESPDSFIEHFSHANLEIRKTNISSEREDWQRFLNKWEGIYYDKEKPYYGKWEYKPYLDKNNTFMQFPPIDRLEIKLKKLKSKYKYLKNQIAKKGIKMLFPL